MASRAIKLTAVRLTLLELAGTNKVYVSDGDYANLKAGCDVDLGLFCVFKGYVFTFDKHESMKPGTIGLNNPTRGFTKTALNEILDVAPFVDDALDVYLSKVVVEVDYFVKTTQGSDYKVEDLAGVFDRVFAQQYLTTGQECVADVFGTNLKFTVRSLEVANLSALMDGEKTGKTSQRGIFNKYCTVNFEKARESVIRLVGASGGTSVIPMDFDFSKLGIGGLDAQLQGIFRQAFLSRVFSPAQLKKKGINVPHAKGMLLYGPPGTGKTLIARQIGAMLNGKKPKVVNGPEILNKYVGQSEENIRNLFKEAEAEQKERGDASDLHIIIFDEIDAICKQRGSRGDSTGVGDTVVNQLLSKIDGVDALNNVLLIGMTNRKDMIDEAMLRAGRLEIHVEISLPDREGRLQILNIHTASMREAGGMSKDVDLESLSYKTKNYSGSEIQMLVRRATTYAFQRLVEIKEGVKIKDKEDILVTHQDFEMAVAETVPMFGVDEEQFEGCMRNGIIPFSQSVEKILKLGQVSCEQVRVSKRTPLVSLLLEGPAGSGKTSLAAKIATMSDFPFLKMISAETMVGYSEQAKCSKITKIFEDSYRSPLSCIVIDDMERILDYSRIGPRFSNTVLQTLLVSIRREPPKGKNLLIIATGANRQTLEDLEILDSFSSVIRVPQVSTPEEFSVVLRDLSFFSGTKELEMAASAFMDPISIKKLIMVTEMAKTGKDQSDAALLDRLIQHLNDIR
eukprot:TRINITY_DN1966_c0_g1_i1.p1 TRINITY_DN1966_c0_g1~~TRINITY_DN1966_c0_g1_i1.p1  ORF type:complete len:737 (-),score=286.48 TRINITY_DN1966_c0_g1_i1:39-2249(-)